MSEPYTPDTETVREQYTREQPPHIGTVSSKCAEFDRWLAGVKADAWDEGYSEGHSDGFSASSEPYSSHDNYNVEANPYRNGADR